MFCVPNMFLFTAQYWYNIIFFHYLFGQSYAPMSVIEGLLFESLYSITNIDITYTDIGITCIL